KINHLDVYGEQLYGSKGGIKLTKQVVEEIFKQPIDYWLRVDFSGFQKVIDLLDGIEVNVDRSFTDNSYPAPNSQFQTISFHSGKQIMDGARALQFVRSRHGNNGEGSDFARADRQQKVILAIEKKISDTNVLTNPQRLWTLFNLFNEYVETNISWLQIVRFSKIIKNLDNYQIIQKVIKSGEQQPLYVDYVNDAYVLKVKGDNFDTLAEMADDIFSYSSTQITNTQENLEENNLPFNQDNSFDVAQDKPFDFTQDNSFDGAQDKASLIKIVILNGTRRNGLAADLSVKLKDFNIVAIANAWPQNYQQTNFYATKPVNNQISEILEKQLGINLNKSLLSTTNLPDSIKQYQTKANYVIIIGNNYVE
ncbi:MAG: LCP family protein, partial [Candidatus Aenigmarchaeota archaeon]|nr:LCP family protein [Candidatus Aenigmarchaeota archaeon]